MKIGQKSEVILGALGRDLLAGNSPRIGSVVVPGLAKFGPLRVSAFAFNAAELVVLLLAVSSALELRTLKESFPGVGDKAALQRVSLRIRRALQLARQARLPRVATSSAGGAA